VGSRLCLGFSAVGALILFVSKFNDYFLNTNVFTGFFLSERAYFFYLTNFMCGLSEFLAVFV